ncbi:MAG: protein kinase [Deltaproteobacteria bacterium]|nr:protein kinase [Deltaproteobacteria bacterium]
MAEAESGAAVRECPSCHSQFAGESFCPNDGTRLSRTSELPAPVDPMIGSVFAERYRIVRRIGEGGMGVVYEAEHVVIEKRVAVKLLRESYAGRADVLERFKQEAKSASRIGHENIVDITDFGQTENGGVFFVMEYLEGEDLADVLRKSRTVPSDRAVPIVLQVCKGLSAAHGKGIIHRDMKPENIFLAGRDGSRDFVKILDFGIAKMNELDGKPGEPGRRLTKTGMIFGTPEYMSPEQAAGRALDHRVDIYSVGVIMYEMFVGRVPFTGDTFMGILTKHMFDAPPPMRQINPRVVIQPALEGVIFKALSKEPGKRHQTMTALLEDVQHAVANPNAVVASLPAATLESPRVQADFVEELRTHTVEDEYGIPSRRKRGSRVPVATAALAVLLVGGGLGAWVAVHQGGEERAPREDRVATPVPPRVPDPPPAPTPVPPVNDTPDPLPPAGAPAPPPPVATIEITLQTNPGGAEAVVGDVVRCAATPCSLQEPEGTELSVVVRKTGRRPQTRVIRFDHARTESFVLPAVTVRDGHPPEKLPPSHGNDGPSRNDLKIPAQWRTDLHP